jgi:hypothetical protein
MDKIQEQHERTIGDFFITEFNRKYGMRYVFSHRGDGGPDLIYSDKSSEVGLEIVTCYYDSNHAKFGWQNARDFPNAPKSWEGVNFNSELIENINAAIQAKCEKAYGPNCLLVINTYSGLTTYNKMDYLLPKIKIPPKHRFVGIYLVGFFGVTGDSNVDKAIWELKPD